MNDRNIEVSGSHNVVYVDNRQYWDPAASWMYRPMYLQPQPYCCRVCMAIVAGGQLCRHTGYNPRTPESLHRQKRHLVWTLIGLGIFGVFLVGSALSWSPVVMILAFATIVGIAAGLGLVWIVGAVIREIAEERHNAAKATAARADAQNTALLEGDVRTGMYGNYPPAAETSRDERG